MEYRNLIFGVDKGIATITFDRPRAMNAMNSETMTELGDAVRRCRDDDGIKTVIVTGSGEKAFVAGADIVEMKDFSPGEMLKFVELGHAVLRMIEVMPKPSIAAINGFAERFIRQGEAYGESRFLRQLLKKRFGEPPEAIDRRIETADAETLAIWFDRALDADTLEDIFPDRTT